MLVRELLPLLTGADRLVDLTPERADLTGHLMIPDDRHHRVDLSAAAAEPYRPGDVLVAAIGPGLIEPDDLAPALAALPTGGRVLLLSTWPAADLPYHRLLDPLGAASMQVTDAVPLSQTPRHGLYVALLATRVTEPLPPRAYLMDLDRPTDAPGEVGLRTLLRMANEHVLGEMVARPVRRRVREQAIELAESRAELAALRIERDALHHRLSVSEMDKAKLHRQLAALQTSASFRVGRTFVDGVKHPARAVVSVPRGLSQIWRTRHTVAPADGPNPADPAAPAPAARPTHRTVSFPVPGGAAERRLRLTAPAALLPRGLKDGLAGYEPAAVAAFLAALDAAGEGAVFDAGAAVGVFAGLAGALTERTVVAFEPASDLAGVARRFALDNDLGFRTESLVLGDRTGTTTVRKVRVPVETLDGYVERTGLVPAVLKLNGPEVLAGAAGTLKAHRPLIVVEGDSARFEGALSGHGYQRYEDTPLFAPEAPDERFRAALKERQEQLESATA